MKYLCALACALGAVGFATIISLFIPIHYIGLILIVWGAILLHDYMMGFNNGD